MGVLAAKAVTCFFFNDKLFLKCLEDEGFQIDFNLPGDGMCFYASAGYQLGLSATTVKTSFLTTCVLIDLMYVLQISFTKAK